MLPKTTLTSVFSLLILVSIPVSILSIDNHINKKTLTSQAHASEGVAQNTAPSLNPKAFAVTVTTPTPTKEVGHTAQQEQIIAFIKEIFGEHADEAILIAKCESGLRPDAVNQNTDIRETIDRGLFQINNYHQKIDNTSFLFDYKVNTILAKKIFDGRGGNWSAWACATKLGL